MRELPQIRRSKTIRTDGVAPLLEEVEKGLANLDGGPLCLRRHFQVRVQSSLQVTGQEWDGCKGTSGGNPGINGGGVCKSLVPLRVWRRGDGVVVVVVVVVVGMIAAAAGGVVVVGGFQVPVVESSTSVSQLELLQRPRQARRRRRPSDTTTTTTTKLQQQQRHSMTQTAAS